LIQYPGLVWLLALLGPLLLVQRALHRQIQTTFLLISRQPAIAITLFSILFFPGVVIHEFSHWLVARLVGVRTGHLSLLPRRMADGRLRMGYVETAEADVFRDALIGAAPLLAGGLFVAYAGFVHLGGAEIQANAAPTDWASLKPILVSIYQLPDFWLWFYLTLAVSSTMFPSSADRRAWLPVGLVAALLILLVVISGAGEWFIENLAPWLNLAIWSSVWVLGISLVVQAALLIPFYLSSLFLSQLTGMRVA